MATGGGDGSGRVYEEDDTLDMKLLNQVKNWIFYGQLERLARNLGFSRAEISCIITQYFRPEQQIFQVFS